MAQRLEVGTYYRFYLSKLEDNGRNLVHMKQAESIYCSVSNMHYRNITLQ
jgi:hypothetical protein